MDLRGQLSNPPFLLARVLKRKWRFIRDNPESKGTQGEGYKSDISCADATIQLSRVNRLLPDDVEVIVAGYERG